MQLLALLLRLDNFFIVFLSLFNYSHVSQVYCLKLDADAHQLIFLLDKLSLSINFLLNEIVPNELLNLVVQIFYLDVLSLDHTVQVLKLQLKLVCSL